jgi:polysaccharide deacetylase family protein (PEP-CTERM system associated)
MTTAQQVAHTTPNLLTFDIEGFVEASHDSMTVPPECISEAGEREEIEVNTMQILEVLAAAGCKGTFFTLGRIARDMPRLVRRIAEAGHELACHSFHHRRLFNATEAEARHFLSDAKRLLEDASGQRVYGFRAPDFSITSANPWAFDVLRDLGYVYDSSVVPTTLHDVYGIRGFPTSPFRMANGLIEFPMSTMRVGRWNVPVGGGGYFRLYPLALTTAAFRMANRARVPRIVYLHPFEMGVVVPRIPGLGLIRHFRTYTGVTRSKAKLQSLLRQFQFMRMVDYIDQVPIADLPGS